MNNNLPEEWELFNRIFAELKPPRHVVPGNHDVLFNYDFVEASYSAAPKNKPEYAKIVRQALEAAADEGFTGAAALYQKYTGAKPAQLIEHQGCAFITVPFLTTRADAEQLKFLRDQLARTSNHRHVFVDFLLQQLAVDPLQDLTRPAEHAGAILPAQPTREILQQHGDECRRSAVSRHIRHVHCKVAIGDAEVVDEISAEHERGNDAVLDAVTVDCHRIRRQHGGTTTHAARLCNRDGVGADVARGG